jgi:hypothetical protein
MHIVRVQKDVFTFQIDGNPAASTQAQNDEYAPRSQPPHLTCHRIKATPTSPITAGSIIGHSAAFPVIFITPTFK